MKFLFNKDNLEKIATSLSSEYINNIPYPHCVIDNFLENSIAEKIHQDFPKEDQIQYYKYDNSLEKKLAMDNLELLPDSITEVLLNFNSPNFLNFLEKLTGIEGLIPDPYLRGGGIHKSPKGGKLDIHIDFNIHPKLNLERRINVLLYLNKDWEEEYNGDFQLWKGKKENETHILEKLEKKIYPIFNRLVIFNTSENSYHGFPQLIECPEGIFRNSLALYYYTANGTSIEAKRHSTVYVKLPGEDDGVDLLREQRKLGRIASDQEVKNIYKL